MKKIISLILIAFISSCHGNFFNYDRKDINDYSGQIVTKQHCGFDGLEDSFYMLKDTMTQKITKVSVEPEFCDIYAVGDTIK